MECRFEFHGINSVEYMNSMVEFRVIPWNSRQKIIEFHGIHIKPQKKNMHYMDLRVRSQNMKFVDFGFKHFAEIL